MLSLLFLVASGKLTKTRISTSENLKGKVRDVKKMKNRNVSEEMV
jgi:hypothetical protein